MINDQDKRKRLDELKQEMETDSSLPLREKATKLVFGDGNPDTEVLFIGEAPGYWEDQKGIPFVGNAGALLNQALAIVGMPREEVFITNVIHYRPPENRDPLPQELEAFRPYVDKIIEVIDPKVIITLGRFSMGKFIPGESISRIHGKPREVEVNDKLVTVIPMYHPAAGLRSSQVKAAFLEDFKKIPQILKEAKESEKTPEPKSEQMSLV